jgi:multicomponent Na+:H+ antiporter subunit G
MELALDIVSAVLLAAGTFLVFVGGVGVMRMPDFYTRMHAASLTDTGGAALVIAGLLVQGGFIAGQRQAAGDLPVPVPDLADGVLRAGQRGVAVWPAPQCRNETGEALPDGSPPLMSSRKAPPRRARRRRPRRKTVKKAVKAARTPAKKAAARKKRGKSS